MSDVIIPSINIREIGDKSPELIISNSTRPHTGKDYLPFMCPMCYSHKSFIILYHTVKTGDFHHGHASYKFRI